MFYTICAKDTPNFLSWWSEMCLIGWPFSEIKIYNYYILEGTDISHSPMCSSTTKLVHAQIVGHVVISNCWACAHLELVLEWSLVLSGSWFICNLTLLLLPSCVWPNLPLTCLWILLCLLWPWTVFWMLHSALWFGTLASSWPWPISWHYLWQKILYPTIWLLRTLDCILTLPLPSDLVPHHPAGDDLQRDLMSCLFSCLLIRCYHVPGSYLVVHSHLSQQQVLPPASALVSLCVFTSPVTTPRGVGQEVQKKPPLQLDHHQVRNSILSIIKTYYSVHIPKKYMFIKTFFQDFLFNIFINSRWKWCRNEI